MEQMTVSLPKLALLAAAGGLVAYFVAPKRSRMRWAGYAALATGVGGYVVTQGAIKQALALQRAMTF